MTLETTSVRRQINRLAGAALVALVLISGGAAAEDGAAIQGLTVHRGTDILAAKDRAARAKAFEGQDRAVSGGVQSSASGVTVVRGHGWHDMATFEAGVAAVKRPRFDVVGGDGGWFIDREGGRLINCFRVRTAAVGGYRIRCSSRPLP